MGVVGGMKENRVYSLDILRIIAATMIVLHHYQQVTNSYFGGRFNFRGYSVVVEFFFFLSGYLAWRYTKTKQVGFIPFIKKKALRLLPLVAISSVVYEILLLIYINVCEKEWFFGNDISIWGIVLNTVGLQCGWFFDNPGVNNPTWYVSVLLLCYVIYWLLDALSRKCKVPSVCFWVAMVMIGVLIRFFDWNLPFLNAYSARGYYSFFWGLLMAGLVNRKKLDMKWTLFIITILLGLYFGVDWLVLLYKGIHNYVLVFICYPLLVSLFLSEPVKKLLDFRMLGILGEATYDIYVWHIPLMLAMYIVLEEFQISLNLDYYKCLIAFVVGAYLVGIVSYFVMNRPIQRLVNRL